MLHVAVVGSRPRRKEKKNESCRIRRHDHGMMIYATMMLSFFCLSFKLSAAVAVAGESISTERTTEGLSSLEDLGFDENGKLASYHLVYPADDNDNDNGNDECVAMMLKLEEQYGIVKTALTGEALDFVFPNWNNSNSNRDGDKMNNSNSDEKKCVAAVLERGTDRSVVGYPMPNKRWSQTETEKESNDDSNKNGMKSLSDWYFRDCRAFEICLMNYLDQKNELKVYWVRSEDEDPIYTISIKFGERNTKCFTSYMGHHFIIKDYLEQPIADDNYTDFSFTVEYPLILGIGEAPQHTRTTLPSNHYDGTIDRTLRAEWDRHHVPQRTFSSLGFSKGRLPNDVFGSMGAFFYNNRHNKHREEWSGKGVFVNWWQTDVFMLQIPWSLKQIWQMRLVDLVSKWAGVPCEQTVMYGLRQYEAGARLLTHVDRLSTHVVSLIVNVAQGGLDQEWPVEVFDHAGRLHEVVMEPGDIVYYESAKNLHSRNRPLVGEHAYYTNLFTHYRPTGMDAMWYKSPTPEGRQPLLDGDDIGDIKQSCKKPPQVTGKKTEYLGYGKVRCKDRRLGHNISPSLFVAKGPDDLIHWWKRTSPEGEHHGDYDDDINNVSSQNSEL
eukprot:CAMPEP_0197828226 /NCGR_PEP_ID=MMETSP1437-20131217/4854_1 /TAXON_ID=49252 ORGANISM="Eucampia antarctica, Strain CCMP1452" /NCGR_SAMPLE_ID=MMETSP1437 /ASSEMBLY_ACC=CAM_ASM_001096 /LENGTH=607 /DNA_ID=CAMNT_0043429391 /DNA_START=24 /DNA_END=1847 /DNA_ORIENTATION=+